MDKIKQIGFKAGEKPKRPVIQEDTSASKSYASIAYGISEGEIVGLIDGAKSVYLDGTPVQSVSGDVNIPDVKIQERKGTNDQTHLEGFPAVVNEKQYNNIEMLQTTPFVHYINDTNLDAVGIRFTFGALQTTDPDNGNVSGITVEYAIDVQADGQGYQELLRTSIVGKYSAGYQRYHRVELPQADEGWEVRIRRLTPNTTSTYIADKMYLDAVAEILDVKMRYPNTALIGLKFDSERFSNIPKVDFRMRGKIIRVPANYDPVARTYAQSGAGTTNGIWNGQFKMAYTTNPAWIFYDLVLNRRYGLGNRIDASMLDKWSLYSIAQYCDVMVPDGEGGLEPRFTCNVYINNRFEAYDCLMQLAGVFRGIMYWSGTAIIAGCDRPQDPVFTYTRANIVGEFNYSGTRTKDRHSVVMVSFDDPRNNYKTEKEVVSDRKAISEIGIRTKDLAAFACTSRGQAQRAGKWALFKEQFETRIVTFALGMDGYIAPVGRIIEIADPLLAGRSVGGRIAAVSVDKKTITLDRDTEVKVGDRLVLNNEEGEQESRQVTKVSGRAVTVAVAFESPAVEHVWAIDSNDLQLMRFTVISVAENRSQDSINFTVTALQHEPSLHEAADYSAYVDRNTYSTIDITTQKAPTEVTISSVNRINQGIDLTDLVISWKQAENAVKYQVQWRRDDGNWIQMPLQYGNQVTVENIYHGVYEAKVVAINAADVNSLPASSAPTPINSKFAEPAVLASLTANGILFGVELRWKFPLYGAQNAAFVEIYWALNVDKGDEKLLGAYAYPTTETTVNGLSPHQTLYFRARLVDRNGVASGFTPWVTATVIADPEKLLDILNGHIGLEAIDAELSKAIGDNTTGVSDAKALANQAKTDAEAKVQALKDEVDPKILALQNGITQVTEDYQDADTRVVGQLNAYKTSNDSSVASVLQKAESAIATGSTNSSAITAINGQISTIDGTISTKADASALSSLTTRVEAEEGKSTSQGSAITALQNTINHATTGLSTKASSSALTAVDNKVIAVDGRVTTTNSNVATLTGRVETVEGGLTKKADATALNSYYTKVEADTAIAGQITAYKATVDNALGSKLNASVITNYYTSAQTDNKIDSIAAGKIEEFKATYNLADKRHNLLEDPFFRDPSKWWGSLVSLVEQAQAGSDSYVVTSDPYPRLITTYSRTGAANGFAGDLFTPFTCEPEVTYQISLDLRRYTTGAKGNWQVYLAFYDLAGAEILGKLVASGALGQETSTSVIGTVISPAGALRASVRLRLSMDSNGEVYVNNLSVANLKVVNIPSFVSNALSTLEATVETQTTAVDGILAKHTVKINNNGFVSGYGLISTANNGAVVSAFKVDADAFAVGKSGSGILPFVVTTAGQTISGIRYPAAGTWINSAYIASATIGTAHIADLAVETAKIDNGAITTAKIGDLQVDTLKIKDNAVTVPLGTVSAQRTAPTTNSTASSSEAANIDSVAAMIGDLATLSITRAGGKVRIDAGVSVSNIRVGAYPAANTDGEKIYLSIVLLRNNVVIGRYKFTEGAVEYSVKIFNGSYVMPPFIDSAGTGATTYAIRVGFAIVKAGSAANVDPAMAGKPSYINSASLAILELKK